MRYIQMWLLAVAVYYMLGYWVSPWASLGVIALEGLAIAILSSRRDKIMVHAMERYLREHPEIIGDRPGEKQP